MSRNQRSQAPRSAATKPPSPPARPPQAKPVPRTAPLPKSLQPPPPKRFDTSSPAYKTASGKYTRFMVAMPILLVTSYYLFDRLINGNEAKSLAKTLPARDTE